MYWCTADIGWITGHSYITYGPMANAATSVLVRDNMIKLSLYDKEIKITYFLWLYHISELLLVKKHILLLLSNLRSSFGVFWRETTTHKFRIYI